MNTLLFRLKIQTFLLFLVILFNIKNNLIFILTLILLPNYFLDLIVFISLLVINIFNNENYERSN